MTGLALLLLALAPASHAASSVQAGWWTSAPAATAPDAQNDGLLVQGSVDPTKPVAYAAVAYALTSGEQPVSVKLTVADGSASTPGAQLSLCPLAGPFSPAQGGAMTDGPKFDCGTKVSAGPAADGKTYAFDDVSGLARSGALAVAIVPDAATDRVVLTTPGPDSLTTQPGATASSASSSSDAAATGSSDAPSTGFERSTVDSGSSATDAAPLDLGTVDAAPTPDTPPAADATAASSTTTTTPARKPTATGGTTTAATQPVASSHHGGFPRGVLAAGAAALAGVLWFSAGRGEGVATAEEDGDVEVDLRSDDDVLV